MTGWGRGCTGIVDSIALFLIWHFVANFVGQGKWLDGTVVSDDSVETAIGRLHGRPSRRLPEGTKVRIFLRPDDVVHDDNSNLQAKVVSRRFLGSEFLYELEADTGCALTGRCSRCR